MDHPLLPAAIYERQVGHIAEMGTFFGMGCRSATRAMEDAGPLVFEKVDKRQPIGLEGEQIGFGENVQRITVYDGQSEAAMKLRSMGFREVGK